MAKSERIGEGVIKDGALFINGYRFLGGYPAFGTVEHGNEWRQAWEQYKEKWPIEYNVVNAVGGDSPWQSRVPDGPVYLVRWECERCHGTYIGCGGCNETGYVYEIEPKGDNE
jgi:hypothetical protein